MYEEFYHFSDKPFTLSPDPAFLYLGKSHRRAMNILEYGVESESGITVISGEVGTGKTTLVRNLLSELGDEYTVGMITNTQRDFGNLLKWVLHSYGIDTNETDHVNLHKTLVEFIASEHRAGAETEEPGKGQDRDAPDGQGCGRQHDEATVLGLMAAVSQRQDIFTGGM